MELKHWLAKRKTSLEQPRTYVEPIWRDIRQYYEPNLGKAMLDGDPSATRGQREDEKILNSEPRNLLHRMAAGLQSGITNQARQWFRFITLDKRLAEHGPVRKWLSTVTDVVQGAMNRSNIYPSLDQIYMHLGAFGTSAGLIVPDNENTVHLHISDEGAYWIAENRRGRVSYLLRRIDMTVAQLIEEFGEGWMPDKIMQDMKAARLETSYQVWNLICPHDPDRILDVKRDRPFVSIYWIDGHADNNAGILAIRSFPYNPIIAPRWAIINAQPYGVGCGEIGLGDAKQLQRQEMDKLRLIAQEVDPALIAAASMKGEPINVGPGGVTYAADHAIGTYGRGGAPVQRLFETHQQIQGILMAIDATEKKIAKSFYADLFSMMLNLNLNPKQMTAREVNELNSEKVALLGPILTRLNTDLLDPLVDSIFYICSESGMIPPPPPELEGTAIKTEYVSALHIDQQSGTKLSGLYRIAEFVGGLVQYQPNVTDKVDFDQMVDEIAMALVEPGVIRSDNDVEQIRRERVEQERQIRQAEMMAKSAPAMARAAKDLSSVQPGNGSALDAAMGVPS